MKCYFDVWSGQKSKRGEGAPFIPPHTEVIVGVSKIGRPERIRMGLDRSGLGNGKVLNNPD
jgi:hypothetical protein